jgi:hypothetical protein
MYSGETAEPAMVSFAKGVARLSDGTVRVRIVSGWTRPGDLDEEGTLLADLASGLADLGWVGTRAVGATLGVRRLDALDAPLLFPNHDAVCSAVCGPLAGELAELPRRTGLLGLSVVPGAFRRPLGFGRALVSAADWRGAVIRMHKSLVEEATLRALGAEPVLRHARDLRGPRPAGIDGMDIHADAIGSWGYTGTLTWNVRLWPRTLLLVANRRNVKRFGIAVEALLRAAALQTATKVAADLRHGEADDLTAVPSATTILRAGREELAEIRHAVEPVYETLLADPDSRPILDRLTQQNGRCTWGIDGPLVSE